MYSAGAEQRGVQERGAPGDGERGGGAPVAGLLLQPAERRPGGAHAGAGGAGKPGAVPGDDLRRVPRAHPPARSQRQGAATVAAELPRRRLLLTLASPCCASTPLYHLL